jgi:hypothetical protein
MTPRIAHPTSRGASDGSRGVPRNATPKPRVIASALVAPTKPRSAAVTARATLARVDGAPPLASPRTTTSSLQNPLSGGSPAIARPPRRNSAAVHGMARASPPRRSRSTVWVAWWIAPAP